MASLSLPSRQILKRRVQTFGQNRPFRFGYYYAPIDITRWWAMAEAGASPNASEAERYDARNAVDWNGLYKIDYNRARRLDIEVHRTGQPRWEPAKATPVSAPMDVVNAPSGTVNVPSNPVVIVRSNPIPNAGPLITVVNDQADPNIKKDPPVTGTTGTNVGIPNPPGMTDAEYLAIVEKAKFDAAVIAAANAGRNVKLHNDETLDISLTPPDPKIDSSKIGSSKSFVLPAMAAIVAYLMFKG